MRQTQNSFGFWTILLQLAKIFTSQAVSDINMLCLFNGTKRNGRVNIYNLFILFCSFLFRQFHRPFEGFGLYVGRNHQNVKTGNDFLFSVWLCVFENINLKFIVYLIKQDICFCANFRIFCFLQIQAPGDNTLSLYEDWLAKSKLWRKDDTLEKP